jgi:aerobic-type carbon monoxide dehydrogenase small subunit (CoxS/CutS family)
MFDRDRPGGHVMANFSFWVNGERRAVDADESSPLLWVLRDNLSLTGTKYGCGIGQCGPCTVLEGERADRAVRACRIPLAEAAGRRYTTIEGLSADGSHACQRAWLEENVSQCGYCQPGMMLEIAALLRSMPSPNEADIDRVLGDHLCRCGSYPRVRAAALRAAKLGGGR